MFFKILSSPRLALVWNQKAAGLAYRVEERGCWKGMEVQVLVTLSQGGGTAQRQAGPSSDMHRRC